MSAFHQKPKPESGERKPRKCLMCRSTFSSSWAGDRVCKSCKGTNSWREGSGPQTFGVA